MKTYLPKVDEIQRNWILVDATGVPVGRLATKITDVLRGKNKPVFTPHLDTGDFVVVINAKDSYFTGKKSENKIYQDYTGWMGGQKEYKTPFIRERHPERIIQQAVKGMMPKNRLGRQMLTKLKIYPGAEHPHAAQNPVPTKLV